MVMKIRNYGLSLAFLGVVVAPWAVSGCSQVATQCIVGPAESAAYIAIYKEVSHTGTCPTLPKMDLVGVENFHPLKGHDDRDLTKSTVAIQTEAFYDFANNDVAGCFDAPDPVSGYKGGTFDDTNPAHHLWATGHFRDLLPDANDLCYIDTTDAAIIATPAVTPNPAPACLSPAGNCTAADGTFNDSCICAKNGDEDCCDAAHLRCKGDPKSTCKEDVDCCDPGDAGCMASPVKGSCAMAASSLCINDKAITNCEIDDDCCPADPDTGAPDPACTSKPHTCFPGGPDLATCHAATIAANTQQLKWTDMKFVNTSGTPGTQFQAKGTYSDSSCKEQVFSVIAMWPAVACILTGPDGATPVDQKGNPLPPGAAPLPNDAACCPSPDVAHGLPSGSGINPNFPVHCDHDLLYCVLDGDTVPQDNGQGYPKGCPKPEAPAGSVN